MSSRERGMGDVSAGDPTGEHPQITHLVKEYFDVCNTALARGADGDPRRTLLDFLEQFATGETISLEVSGTGAEPGPRYTTTFVNGRFSPVRAGGRERAAHFTLGREFLEDVARNAAHYVRNPEDLDWSWLSRG